MLSSLVFDYVARLKIAGNHLNFFIAQQLPAIEPTMFTNSDLAFLAPRVLELTYSSESLRAWAVDLGYNGVPFVWNADRRNHLKAELDAYIARKWGLSRDELRYILDPADVKGGAYPSETFRVLQASERRDFGEYRTGKLVLQAYDQIAAGMGTTKVIDLGAPITIGRQPQIEPTRIPDGAWSRPLKDKRGETGAMLAALLKAVDEATPSRQLRLAAILALEPRLLHAHLDRVQSAEWRRVVGDEAEPLPKGAVQFVASQDHHWGVAVRGLRTSGALIEDTNAGTWARGPGLDKIETDGWPDARAGFVLNMLRSADAAMLAETLPAEVRRWLDAEAA